MTPKQLLEILPVALPVFFIGFFLTILWVIAHVGGWSALARDYPAGERPEGLHFSGRSLRLGLLGGYNNCLNVTLSRAGVYLVPSFFFSFAHPPLLIPWAYVGPMQEKKIIFRWYSLPIDVAGRHLELSLPGSAKEWIKANIPA